MASSSPSPVPRIHLLCMEERFIAAFKAARKEYGLPDSVDVTYHAKRLSQLSRSVKFDLIVSPANSYGRLDGGFDDAISRAFSPKDDYLALTRTVQARLYEKCRGFLPPGSCDIVPFAFEKPTNNVWGCKYIAMCPTMKIPQEVKWDKEIVYECIWSLLCAINNHNIEAHAQNKEAEKIKHILMTPLGTGCGRLSEERWAAQTVLAIKHFIEACHHPEKWSKMEVPHILDSYEEVSKTYEL